VEGFQKTGCYGTVVTATLATDDGMKRFVAGCRWVSGEIGLVLGDGIDTYRSEKSGREQGCLRDICNRQRQTVGPTM
jgi:hypothetical protein